MLNLIKYLKSLWFYVTIIIVFLFFQANFDLALPTYTSKIVNIGIQQGGIEKAVPSILSEETFKLLVNLSNSDTQSLIQNSYQKTNKNITDYDKYLDSKEYLYKLREGTLEKKLEKELTQTIMLINIISNDKKGEIQKNLFPNIENKLTSEELLNLISNLEPMIKEKVIISLSAISKEIPDTIKKQASINYIKNEYSEVGLNMSNIQKDYIIKSGVFMLILSLISMLITIIVGILGSLVAAKVGKTLRSKVFDKVLSFSEVDMRKFSISSLVTRSTNDIVQIQQTLVMALRILIYAPILGIGGILKVMDTNSNMVFIIVMAIGAIITIISILIFTVIPKYKKKQSLIDKLNLVSRESLNGIAVIRAFSNQKHEEKKFEEANTNIYKNDIYIYNVMAFMYPAMMFVMNVVSIVIVYVSAEYINDGTMQLGDMMAFIQYTMQVMISFLMISIMSMFLPRAIVAASRVNEVLNQDTLIEEENHNSEQIKGEIEFKNVSFKYEDSDDYVLDKISFKAKVNEVTAIIGSTGSGKTTIVNLIPRFFEVTEGDILIDKKSIKNININSLRQAIGFVSQKGILFKGTITENINFGNKNDKKEIIENAAAIAEAKNFIENFEDKYEHNIAQGGSNVSGGQKQRLAIARAIAKNPNIYIFDDSFSALDYKTDSNLRKNLFKTTKNKTTIIVAQRISTVLNADQIIVLDEGKIVGIGKHTELLKTCEVYKQIAESQLTKEELA